MQLIFLNPHETVINLKCVSTAQQLHTSNTVNIRTQQT